MKNWTIAKRLICGFGAVLAIVTALGGYAVLRLRVIDAKASSIKSDSVPGTVIFGEIESLARQNQSLVLEMALSEDKAREAELDKALASQTERNNALYERYEKTIFDEDDRRAFDAVKSERARMKEARTSFVAYAKSHNAVDSGLEFERTLKPAFDAYSKAIRVETDMNGKTAIEESEAISQTVTSLETWMLAGVFVALLLGAGTAFYIVRNTNRILQRSVSALTEGSEQIVSAAGQVSTSAQSLSQGATEQAASLEETSASMEEMASMTRKNAENAQSAAGLMAEVDGSVRQSNQALGDMVTSMAAIQESSQKVAKIIKTIDEIAFQTNILALNAAVEAARAGEAGMGFAVVADEVRNLAQRSAKAAKDTAALIEESIAKAQSGNVKVEQVAGAISGITDSVTKVKGLVEEVSVASRQQSQGIDQVSQAVAQMEKVTQTTAATAEESAAASEELNAQAETSLSVVAELRALVGGTKAGRAPASAAARRPLSIARPAFRGNVAAIALLAALLGAAVPAKAQSADALPELVTDRPDFTESSDVVGKGMVRFETGTTVEFNQSPAATERTMTAPLGLVRIGLSDRVELRLSADGFVASTVKAADGTVYSHGASDMEIGVKVRAFHSEAWGFDAAVIPMVTVPTGSSGMSSGAYDPTLKLTYAKSLGHGFDLSGNVNFSRVTDGGDVFSQRAYSFSVGHDLGRNWGAYWEAYGFSRLEKDGAAAWTLDTGITRGLGGNAQADVEIGRGITEAAPDWFVGFGFAVRTRGFGRRK